MAKWPKSILLLRHDVTTYNALKRKKDEDPEFHEFIQAYNENHRSVLCKKLADRMRKKYKLESHGPQTPVIELESRQAIEVGKRLKEIYPLPDVIFVSPFLRTKQTLAGLTKGWPELENVKTYEEERIREQDHGLSEIFYDWRVFNVFYPDQKDLYDALGDYWYVYPQGENRPMLRDRLRAWLSTLTRDFKDKRVLAITHHLAILSFMANIERWSEDEFRDYDKNHKPINLGVTHYLSKSELGQNGKLALEFYNKKFYE